MNQEFLNNCFSYQPETGVLHWKLRPLEHFKSQQAHKRWNARFAGKRAGSLGSNGNRHYWICVINRKRISAHRLIMLMLGRLSDGMEVDHMNGNGLDNRLVNLRIVSRRQNNMNLRRQSRNGSGVTGVRFNRPANTFSAFIISHSIREWLGTFDNLLDAACARKSAEHRYGFGPSHGAPMR